MENDDPADERSRLLKRVDTNDEENRSLRAQVVGYMMPLSACVLFAIGLSSAQALGGIIPAFELNAFRCAAELVIVTIPVMYKRLVFVHQRSHWAWIMLCCILSSTFNVCFYTASIYLPVGTLGGANYATMVIVTAALTAVCSKECSWPKAASVIMCVVGILFSTQPGFLFPNRPPTAYNPICRLSGTGLDGNNTENLTLGSHNSTAHHHSTQISNEIKGYSLMLVGAVSIVVMTFIIFLRLRNVSFLTINFWVGLTGAGVSAVAMGILEKPSLPYSLPCAFLMLGHSFGTAGGNICVRIAAQMISPLMLSMLESLNIVLLFTLQYTLMSRINPGLRNAYEFVGAGFVVVGNALVPCWAVLKQYCATQS